MTFNIGDMITNGSSAGKVIEKVGRDPRWKTHGLKVQNMALEEFGGNVGQSSFVPGYLLSSWRLLPLEWTSIGGGLEERYVWTANLHGQWLQREIRKIEVSS